MIASHCTKEDLFMALGKINNNLYDGNITFVDVPQPKGKRWSFRLTVHKSNGPGGRRSPIGRRVHAACWHVHGTFFEALLAINPAAVIRSAGGIVVTKDGGNWQDRNIGSMVQPMMYSEACDC